MVYPVEKEDTFSSCERLVVDYDNQEYFESGQPTTNKTGCDDSYVFDYSKYKSSARIDVSKIKYSKF